MSYILGKLANNFGVQKRSNHYLLIVVQYNEDNKRGIRQSSRHLNFPREEQAGCDELREMFRRQPSVAQAVSRKSQLPTPEYHNFSKQTFRRLCFYYFLFLFSCEEFALYLQEIFSPFGFYSRLDCSLPYLIFSTTSLATSNSIGAAIRQILNWGDVFTSGTFPTWSAVIPHTDIYISIRNRKLSSSLFFVLFLSFFSLLCRFCDSNPRIWYCSFISTKLSKKQAPVVSWLQRKHTVFQFQLFHSQEWSMSNFPCSLARNITSHSMENLAFHSFLRWKMISILLILTTSPTHFLFQRLGEHTFWTWEWKG